MVGIVGTISGVGFEFWKSRHIDAEGSSASLQNIPLVGERVVLNTR